MFYNLRSRLAKFICPELKEELEQAERDRFFVDTVLSLRNWCSEDVPILNDVVDWVSDKTRIHFMTQEEYNNHLVVGGRTAPPIHDIRQHLLKYVRVGDYYETF